MIWCSLAFAGQIEGYVFSDLDGAPSPGVHVRVADTAVQTDASGRFVATVDAGTWQVRFEAPGWVPGTVEVRVSDNGVTEILATMGDDLPRFLIEQPGEVVVSTDQVATVSLEGRVFLPDGKPFVGARVFARGVEGLVRTDTDGRFVLEVPDEAVVLAVVAPGYTAFESEVVPGEPVRVDLVEAPRALAAYTVTAPYLEGSVAGLLEERKDGSQVADVLGADEMSRAGDSDAASALSRVTGLTVVGGKYVFVRGLGDRYSASLLDNGVLPSPEPERRVVPLDLFPTSVLAGVVVQKTWSPQMPGEFGGGVVQLETIEAPTAFTASIGLSGTYTHGTTFRKGLVAPGGAGDLFGMDAGTRALPDTVAAASDSSPLEEGDLFSDRGYTADELEKLGEAMPNRWSPALKTLPPGFGVSASLGTGFENGANKGGILGAVTFGNDRQRLSFDRTYYVPSDGELRPQHRYRFEQATTEVSLGAFLTGGLTLGDHDLKYTGMLTRSSDDTARIYEGYNDDVGGDIRISRIRWVERQNFWHRLGGEHQLGKLKVGWHGIYGTASRLEPDRRETRYDNEPGTDRWLLSDRPEGNGIFYSDAGEHDGEGALDLTLTPWRTEERDGPKLMAGGRATLRVRGVDTRRFKYFHKGPASRDAAVLAQDPESVFVEENIGADGFQFEEFTRQTDNYAARHTILAGYLAAEIPITRYVVVSGGARVESSRQNVETFELFNPDQVPITAQLNTVDVLPSLNLTVAPVDSVRVRLGGARTVSRPDFRELSPATFNDVTGGRQTFGNPELQRATIDHFDARLEWFPRAAEVVSVGFFAKRFTAPVETVVVPSAQQSVSWENAERATNLGVELELRRNLPLNFWGAANLALIRSRVELGDNAGVQTSDERRLQGQSPYVVNLQGGWEHPDNGDRLTLLFNLVGPRITEVGAQGAPDILERPVPRLDLVGRKSLGGGWSVSLKGKNLLDPAVKTTQGDQTIDAIRSGWSASVGLGWRAP